MNSSYFTHKMKTIRNENKKNCHYFKRGYCQRGEKCKYLHIEIEVVIKEEYEKYQIREKELQDRLKIINSNYTTYWYIMKNLMNEIENEEKNINEIKKILYQDETIFLNESEIKHLENKENCNICLESSIHETVILRCNHMFCYKCISEWFENDLICPTCRKDISNDFYTNLKLLYQK